MAQEDDSGGEVDKSLEVFSMVFIANDQTTEVEEPGKQPLDLPSPSIASQWSTVLGRLSTTPSPMRGNHLGAVLLSEFSIQPVTVVCLVPNESFGRFVDDALIQCLGDQLHFSWRSTFCPQGERKTMAVCNAHDLGSLAPLGLPDQAPPFLAGTNVPSTKHSFRSKPPLSWRCCASANNTFSIAPESTQSWKRRWTVWYGPYRGGRSFQGAPVRKIHSAPLSTLRRSLQGRPRPSGRTGSAGRMVSMTSHCSLVKSIHNYLSINNKSTRPNFNYL